MKNKFVIFGIIAATVVLAGVAIFTAMRLYQTGNTAVAPNVPSSKPLAAGRCELSFTLGVSTPTPTVTPTSTPTKTPTNTPTATATAVPECNSICSADSDCPDNLYCSKEAGETLGNCRNSSCSTSPNCICKTATPTATATATSNPQCNNNCTSNSECPNGMMCYITSGTTGSCRNTSCLGESDCLCATATSTSQPELPSVGTKWPTVVGTGFGILVILGSLLLAF